MLYVCGMLCSESESVKTLRIEIVKWSFGFVGLALDTGCTGIIEQLDFEPLPDSETEYIAFLLKPLELLGRVENCEIAVAEGYEEIITPDLQDTLERYKNALTGQKPFGYEQSTWLWDEYMAIADRKEQDWQQYRMAKQEHHEAWLLHTHQSFPCLHQRRGKRHYRFIGQGRCEGCGRWFTWLLDCRQCKLRACKDCTKELKERRPALEEAVRWQEMASE
ncbi:MAG: hypothetical protein Q9184_005219 [Pyrenodesmia sp. 2 TL-2023]